MYWQFKRYLNSIHNSFIKNINSDKSLESSVPEIVTSREVCNEIHVKPKANEFENKIINKGAHQVAG